MSVNNNNSSDTNQMILDLDVSLTPCDWSSFSYFALSLLFFVSGFIITFLSIDENVNYQTLTKYWIIGPLFLFSSLLMATKTIIYLKSKNLIELISRQSDLCISANESNLCNASSIQPPPYETAISNNVQNYNILTNENNTNSRLNSNIIREQNPITPNQQNLNLTNNPFNLIVELPPPSYEEIAK